MSENASLHSQTLWLFHWEQNCKLESISYQNLKALLFVSSLNCCEKFYVIHSPNLLSGTSFFVLFCFVFKLRFFSLLTVMKFLINQEIHFLQSEKCVCVCVCVSVLIIDKCITKKLQQVSKRLFWFYRTENDNPRQEIYIYYIYILVYIQG